MQPTTRHTNQLQNRVQAMVIDRRRGFSLIEILVSILIIGSLLGILLVALNKTRLFVRSASDVQIALSVKTGVEQFQQEFNFLPPLVRERNPNAPRAIEADPGANGQLQISVYSTRNPQDLAFLRTTLALDSVNPFIDARYSEYTVPYYLAGALSTPLTTGPDLPIDGIAGPGLYAPRADGTFVIPRDVANAAAGGASGPGALKRGAKKYESFIPVGDRDLKLVTNTNTTQRTDVKAVDGQGNAVRYYRWEPAATALVPADLNVPRMVARVPGLIAGDVVSADRDLSVSAKARDARFAIVIAGPNGLFGDELIAEIIAKFGGGANPTADEELKLRIRAERDNIVEIGR